MGATPTEPLRVPMALRRKLVKYLRGITVEVYDIQPELRPAKNSKSRNYRCCDSLRATQTCDTSLSYWLSCTCTWAFPEVVCEPSPCQGTRLPSVDQTAFIRGQAARRKDALDIFGRAAFVAFGGVKCGKH